jgi:ParB-like chromosome segregation protein Spo0J
MPDLVPFLIPHHPGPISLAQARVDLPPAEFRLRLRRYLLDHPGLTLAQVAWELGVTRQRAGRLAGRLGRPTCAQEGPRPAPKRDFARERMAELCARVRAGESAEQAAAGLGVSLGQAMRLGFRVREVRPGHGTAARRGARCECWRCRRADRTAPAPRKFPNNSLA